MKHSPKIRRIFAVYCVLVMMFTVLGITAYATDDPITVVNNLSDFIFGLIRGNRHDPAGLWYRAGRLVPENA